MTADRASLFGSDLENEVLISRHRRGKSLSPSGSVQMQCMWSGNTTQASIAKGDLLRVSYRGAQRFDLNDEQI